MEAVYSGAYCVIAANCAANHHDGFLKPRLPREYVGIIPEVKAKTPLYICQDVENFKQHVSEGSLNRRGWVLQSTPLRDELSSSRNTRCISKVPTVFAAKR